MRFCGFLRTTGAVQVIAITCALIFMWRLPCSAELGKQYIKASVLNAATGADIPSASITTTNGLSFSRENNIFFLYGPPNPYDLIASAPGFRSNMATAVFAGPGQTVTVTIRLAPASTKSGTLRGRVTAAGATSGGISGALVFTDLGAIAATDDDGYFTALGPSGTAIVTVAAKGYSAKTIKNVKITASGSRRITVRLNKSISGLTGPVSGSVRDACTGQQLAGVNLISSNGKYVPTTGSRYSITAPPGSTALLACAEGYQCGLQTVTRGFLPFGAVSNFFLVPQQRRMGSVAGSITDNDTGLPVAGARIATDTQDIAFSDQDGDYIVLASPCARVLTVSRQGYETYSAAVAITADGTTELNAALAPLTGCMVSGTIKNILTGLPVAGAQIRTQGEDTAASDDSGAFSISLPSCASVITVCADGFFKASRAVYSAAGSDIISLTVSLIPCPVCRCETSESLQIAIGPTDGLVLP